MIRVALALALVACGSHERGAIECVQPTRHYALPAANLDVASRGSAASVPAPVEPIAIGPGESPWLTAVDTRTHATLWRVVCHDMGASGPPCSGKVVRRGDIAIYGGVLAYRAANWSTGMFAVDIRTGRELWRRRTSFDDAMTLKLAADDDHVYASCWNHLVAYDLATGKLAWERNVLPRAMSPSHGTQLVAGDGVVAFWDGTGAIHLADPDDGADRTTIPWRNFVGDMAIRDGALYVAPMWGQAPESVAAFELTTGRVLWHHDETDVWAVPPMFVDGDALYVRRATDKTLAENDVGTELVALDRETGAIAWRRPLGRATSLSAVAANDRPSTLVAEALGETFVFTRQPAPPQPVTVAIAGTVRLVELTGSPAGLRVRVGATVVTTDADGSFSATVTALGAVEIELLDLPQLATKSAAPVVADRTYVNVDRFAAAYRGDIAVHEVRPWPPD